jgi:hypothetical protein
MCGLFYVRLADLGVFPTCATMPAAGVQRAGSPAFHPSFCLAATGRSTCQVADDRRAGRRPVSSWVILVANSIMFVALDPDWVCPPSAAPLALSFHVKQ